MNSSRHLLFGLLILVLGLLAISTYQFMGKSTETNVGQTTPEAKPLAASADPASAPEGDSGLTKAATVPEQETTAEGPEKEITATEPQQHIPAADQEQEVASVEPAMDGAVGEQTAADTATESEAVASEPTAAAIATPEPALQPGQNAADEERLYVAVAELEDRLRGYIDDAVERASEQSQAPTADELGEQVAARVMASIRQESTGQADVERLNLLTASEPTATLAAEDGPTKLQEVHFLYDSSDLTPGALRKVNEAAEWFRSNNPSKIRVVGFSDTRGKPDYNLLLSQRRADSVASLLIRAGIPADRLEIEGMGESKLPEPTGDNVAEPLNRCVGILAIR